MQTKEFRRKSHVFVPWVACFIFAIAAVFAPANLLAQSSSSAVNGVVTDANQGVLGGAKITLKNVDTNVERSTVTNGTGDYFFNSVVPARYTLTFMASGFETETISAFDVGVAQAVTLNAVLKVGSVTERVTVEASGV